MVPIAPSESRAVELSNDRNLIIQSFHVFQTERPGLFQASTLKRIMVGEGDREVPELPSALHRRI